MERIRQFSRYFNDLFITLVLCVVYITAGLLTRVLLTVGSLARMRFQEQAVSSTWQYQKQKKVYDLTLPY